MIFLFVAAVLSSFFLLVLVFLSTKSPTLKKPKQPEKERSFRRMRLSRSTCNKKPTRVSPTTSYTQF